MFFFLFEAFHRKESVLILKEAFSIGLASFIGVSIRVGLSDAISGYNTFKTDLYYSPYIEIFQSQSYLISNLLGCFIMGICITQKSILDKLDSTLYKAMTIGLCGCITTFSSWMNKTTLNSFEAFTWLVIVVELSMNWSSFTLGIAFSVWIQSIYDRNNIIDTNVNTEPENKTGWRNSFSHMMISTEIPETERYSFLSMLIVTIAFFIILLLIIILISFDENSTSVTHKSVSNRHLLRSMVFAPAGALLRWSLLKWKEVYLKDFLLEYNLHTLIANISAVIIMAFLLVFAPQWTWTEAINDGFNGSLSTVSTFVNELRSLYDTKSPGMSLRYLLLSIIPSVIIISLIRLKH